MKKSSSKWALRIAGLVAVAVGIVAAGVFDRPGDVWYVDGSRPDDAGAGRDWATAKQTIQSAIDRAGAGDVIRVANGVYGAIATNGKRIEIASVNGAEATIIDGGSVRRCATLSGTLAAAVQSRLFESLQLPWQFHLPTMVPSMGMNQGAPPRLREPARRSVLRGFTLRNGAAPLGAGAYGGTLVDCVLEGNEAAIAGGGAWGAALENCALRTNRASWLGGGAWGGTLTNCVLEANRAESGGGAWGGRLIGCTVARNDGACGGGVAASHLVESELVANVGWTIGSGAFGGWLERCSLVGNVMKNPQATNIVAYGSAVQEGGRP